MAVLLKVECIKLHSTACVYMHESVPHLNHVPRDMHIKYFQALLGSSLKTENSWTQLNNGPWYLRQLLLVLEKYVPLICSLTKLAEHCVLVFTDLWLVATVSLSLCSRRNGQASHRDTTRLVLKYTFT